MIAVNEQAWINCWNLCAENSFACARRRCCMCLYPMDADSNNLFLSLRHRRRKLIYWMHFASLAARSETCTKAETKNCMCNFLWFSVKEMWKMWCRNGKFTLLWNIFEHDSKALEAAANGKSWKFHEKLSYQACNGALAIASHCTCWPIGIETSFAVSFRNCLKTCSSVKTTWKFKVLKRLRKEISRLGRFFIARKLKNF